MSLSDLSAALRARQLSSREVTEALLSRIDALDPSLHSYFTVTADSALREAGRADAALAGGGQLGVLHGVPVAVKDLCCSKGVATTAGTKVWRDHVPDHDACVVERLRAAGAVLLGKLAMTEGAYSQHHPEVTAPCNPWNKDRWTGVSSSGSGVATAAGLCFASLGTDTGGSIRFPSAANGVVGLKPTYGRVPRAGVFDLAASLDHIGPICRSVADAAAVLCAVAGFDARDPTSLRAPVPDYCARLTEGVAGLRIGIDESYCSESLDPEICSTVLATRRVFEAAGARLVAVKMPDVLPLLGVWELVAGAEAALAHAGMYPERAEDYGPALSGLLDIGRKMGACDYARAQILRSEFCGRLSGIFEDVDVILCPSMGVPTPPAQMEDELRNDPQMLALLMRFTAPFDFSGSPTISLPCGFTDDGMPISLQLVGRHLEESTLFAAGKLYEDATEWHLRHPPL